jgi:hypothetical protein
MRFRLLLFALAGVAWAWCAGAQTDSDVARDHFEAELQRQCPDKGLQLLSARDLRDGLDDYEDSLSPDLRDRLQQAEQTQCSSLDAGAACVNAADLVAADQMGRIDEVASAICTTFLRCTDQGVCVYAR